MTVSMTCDPGMPIDDRSALVGVVAWQRIGINQLPAPGMTQFNNAYILHQA